MASLTALIRRCREKMTLNCLDTPQQLAYIDLPKKREADKERELRSDNREKGKPNAGWKVNTTK